MNNQLRYSELYTELYKKIYNSERIISIKDSIVIKYDENENDPEKLMTVEHLNKFINDDTLKFLDPMQYNPLMLYCNAKIIQKPEIVKLLTTEKTINQTNEIGNNALMLYINSEACGVEMPEKSTRKNINPDIIKLLLNEQSIIHRDAFGANPLMVYLHHFLEYELVPTSKASCKRFAAGGFKNDCDLNIIKLLTNKTTLHQKNKIGENALSLINKCSRFALQEDYNQIMNFLLNYQLSLLNNLTI